MFFQYKVLSQSEKAKLIIVCKLDSFLSAQFIHGENTQHLSNSCIELSGLSFRQPLQLPHCHFPMASSFTIPKLIGFVPMSET